MKIKFDTYAFYYFVAASLTAVAADRTLGLPSNLAAFVWGGVLLICSTVGAFLGKPGYIIDLPVWGWGLVIGIGGASNTLFGSWLFGVVAAAAAAGLALVGVVVFGVVKSKQDASQAPQHLDSMQQAFMAGNEPMFWESAQKVAALPVFTLGPREAHTFASLLHFILTNASHFRVMTNQSYQKLQRAFQLSQEVLSTGRSVNLVFSPQADALEWAAKWVKFRGDYFGDLHDD